MIGYPIEALRRLAPPASVRVGARVTAVEAEGALLSDATGSVEARFAAGHAPALGAWVIASGTWSGTTLEGASFEVASTPATPFPDPGGEWARMHRDGARVLSALRARAAILRELRGYFDARAFLEVETPLAVPSPGLDLHLSAVEAIGLRAPRYLITSPEYQMKRLLAGGLARIYQVCRCLRRDEEGALHQPEFTMLEWYRAFAGSDEIMRDTEELVACVARALGGSSIIPARGRSIDVAPPWRRITVAEAFLRIGGVSLDDVLPDEERFFRILVDRIEPGLGYPKPVFLTHWPASMASLAQLRADDPRYADRFEAYVDGVELSNGFGELIDPVEQRARLERDRAERARAGLAVYPIDERFLRALEEGLPPCGGNALGFDRLVMLVTGAQNIEEVLAFPQARL